MAELAWLKSPAARWKTFVENRVNHIQETTNVEDQNYINSKENPADLVSHGVDAKVLRNSSLWLNGPNWLQQEETSWPSYEEIADISEERKTIQLTPFISLLIQPNQQEVCTKFSSWNKLLQVIAYCLRFVHNCRFVGNVKPNFEEFCTLLCKVEAVLYLRPLWPLSKNPGNLQVLTPGHFLIGASLLAFPVHNLIDFSSNQLTGWRYFQQMAQRLWKCWSHDYLCQLQQRNK